MPLQPAFSPHAKIARSAELDRACVHLQRIWRGVRARRAFSELFYQAVYNEVHGNVLCPPPSSPGSAPSTPRPRMRSICTTSLEEALEEAGRGRFDEHAQLHSPLSEHRRSASLNSLPQLGRCNQPPSPSATMSGQRMPHSPSCGQSPRMPANEIPDPEVNEEVVANMMLPELHELVNVLTRIIVTRNKELVSLLERRDELEHERDFRGKMVEQLVTQVDKSRSVRKPSGAKTAKPSFGKGKSMLVAKGAGR
ncbi:hypothetical protein AB1Y20_003166 [Prymnesium parvum]|uniref:Uncharacterized protein n=1 Tax=Prymnesium parvum TaxID=97485 RepID=A0AB34JBF6_PRYPA